MRRNLPSFETVEEGERRFLFTWSREARLSVKTKVVAIASYPALTGNAQARQPPSLPLVVTTRHAERECNHDSYRPDTTEYPIANAIVAPDTISANILLNIYRIPGNYRLYTGAFH